MGILRPVVQAFVRAMLDVGHDIALCRAIGSQFVGDHDARRMPLAFEKLSHKAFGGLGIAAALHQNVENEAILINSPPQPVFLAANGDDDLIEVPFVAEPAGGSPPDIIGEMPAEFLHPEAYGLVRNDDPTRRQQVFDHAQTEWKTKIEPDGMSNHLGWKPVAAIKGITNGLGHAARSQIFLHGWLNLQCPKDRYQDVFDADAKLMSDARGDFQSSFAFCQTCWQAE